MRIEQTTIKEWVATCPQCGTERRYTFEPSLDTELCWRCQDLRKVKMWDGIVGSTILEVEHGLQERLRIKTPGGVEYWIIADVSYCGQDADGKFDIDKVA